MRFIKLGLISAVSLFLLITAISLLMPSTVVVSRAVDINANADSIYSLVSDLSKWKLWIENYDSSTAQLISKSTGKGAKLILANTTITIDNTSSNNVTTVWQVNNAEPLPALFEVVSNKQSSVCTLHWQFTQKVKWYPWEKFAAIVSDKALGPFMEKSMENLKKQVEQKQ